MNERLKSLRKSLGLNQKEMGDRLKLSQTHISSLENGAREVTDRIISDICRLFNVNENWLHTGEGEMFVQPATFSLDEYAQKNQLTALELDIIKSYMDLNKEVRQSILNTAQQIFGKHAETTATVEDEIEVEIANYRLELEAEKKARTLSVSQKRETS